MRRDRAIRKPARARTSATITTQRPTPTLGWGGAVGVADPDVCTDPEALPTVDAVAVGAGVTMKSVRRFAVVSELAIVPARQTCEPGVAPGETTCRNGAGLPEDVAYVVDPMTSSPD